MSSLGDAINLVTEKRNLDNLAGRLEVVRCELEKQQQLQHQLLDRRRRQRKHWAEERGWHDGDDDACEEFLPERVTEAIYNEVARYKTISRKVVALAREVRNSRHTYAEVWLSSVDIGVTLACSHLLN